MKALLPLLSACNVWEQLGHWPDNSRLNPAATVITPDNVGSLSERWSSQVAGSFSEPIPSGDRLYITVNASGIVSLRSYDADTGAVIWETAFPANCALSARPVVLVGGALWVNYPCEELLHRLEPATGEIIDSETTGPTIVEGAVVASGSTVAYTTYGGCGQTDIRPELVVRDTTGATGTWRYRFPVGTSPARPCEPSWVTSLGEATRRRAITPVGITRGPADRPRAAIKSAISTTS